MTADPQGAVVLTDEEREAVVGAIAAAINYQSFDARAGIGDLSMAEEIVYVSAAASAPGGLTVVVERIVADRASTLAADLAEARRVIETVRALADEWHEAAQATTNSDQPALARRAVYLRCSQELRRALLPPAAEEER